MKVHFTKLALVGALCGALVACTEKEDRILFEGIYFRAKAGPVDKKTSLQDFEVTVKKANQSLEGAREAGRYEGTRYCVQTFGSSKITWTRGPDDEGLTLNDDKLILRGTCDKTW